MTEVDRYFKIKQLMSTAGSRIFVVHFHKKDGSLRIMKIQNAIAKHMVKGVTQGVPLTPEKRQEIQHRAEWNANLVNVWDLQAEGFRSLNLDTLQEVHINGKLYKVSSNQDGVVDFTEA